VSTALFQVAAYFGRVTEGGARSWHDHDDAPVKTRTWHDAIIYCTSDYLQGAKIESDNADIYYYSYFPTRIKTENIPRSDEVVALPNDAQTTNHCFHDFISTQRSQHEALSHPFAPNPQSQGAHTRYRPKDDGTS
jgi:hypothetical protein